MSEIPLQHLSASIALYNAKGEKITEIDLTKYKADGLILSVAQMGSTQHVPIAALRALGPYQYFLGTVEDPNFSEVLAKFGKELKVEIERFTEPVETKKVVLEPNTFTN